jgi:hypothetical protein
MPLFPTILATTTPAGNHITLGQMVSDVAEWYGYDGDIDREALCRRAVQGAIHDLNRRRLWRFNLIESASFNTVAGTAEYSLATIAPDLWRVYNVRNEGSPDSTLIGMERASYDLMFQSRSGITGYPFARIDFNIYRDGEIIIAPPPDSVYPLTLRYYRLIAIPSDDSAGLDLPQPYQNLPKYQALYHMGLFCGSKEANNWKSEYEQGVAEMMKMDEDPSDEILRFMNRDEIESSLYANMQPSNRPRFLDFY